jgi:lysophospholipid acyltransferase (LPLAT)-like uncharacterized protein
VASPDLDPAPSATTKAPASRWRKLRRRILHRLTWWLGPTVIRLLIKSWKIKVVDREILEQAHVDGNGPIIAFWHQQILTSVGTHIGFPVDVLMSHHRDGALTAHIAGKLGYGIIRGSSSSGGSVALRQMVRAAQESSAVGITPDGPRGPAFQLAPGVFFLTAMLQRPLVATGYAASSYWQAKSWDTMIVPKPFATVVVAYTGLSQVPPRAAAKEGPARDALHDEVMAAMDAAAAKAKAALPT